MAAQAGSRAATSGNLLFPAEREAAQMAEMGGVSIYNCFSAEGLAFPRFGFSMFCMFLASWFDG